MEWIAVSYGRKADCGGMRLTDPGLRGLPVLCSLSSKHLSFLCARYPHPCIRPLMAFIWQLKPIPQEHNTVFLPALGLGPLLFCTRAPTSTCASLLLFHALRES